MSKDENKYIPRGQLLKREGWSKELIISLLGKPDKIEDRKKFPGKKKPLFLMEKVLEVEAKGKLES